MTPDLQTTNTWLAILAVAGALQTLLFLGAAIGMFVMYRRTTRALDALQERHLAPISARASAIMDDLQDMTARARRVDDIVRAKVQTLDHAVHVARDVVADRAWPIVGIARGVSAALRAFTARTPATVTVPARAERATIA